MAMSGKELKAALRGPLGNTDPYKYPPSQIKITHVSKEKKQKEKNLNRFLQDKSEINSAKVRHLKEKSITADFKYLDGTVSTERVFEVPKTKSKGSARSRFNEFMFEWNTQRDHMPRSYESWKNQKIYLGNGEYATPDKIKPCLKGSSRSAPALKGAKKKALLNKAQIDENVKKIDEDYVEEEVKRPELK